MQYVIGSAIILAIVFLVFAATLGPTPQNLKKLRHKAWIVAVGLAAVVTAGDLAGLAALLGPTLVMYEIAAWA